MASGTDNLSTFCPRPHGLRVVVHQSVENRQAGHEGVSTRSLSVVGQVGLEQLKGDTGLLEGFGRQLIQQDWARFAIAAATALFWGCYFYLPRRSKLRG